MNLGFRGFGGAVLVVREAFRLRWWLAAHQRFSRPGIDLNSFFCLFLCFARCCLFFISLTATSLTY